MFTPPTQSGLPEQEHQRWDHVFQNVLRRILAEGDSVALASGKSVGSGRQTRDLRNFQFVLTEPRDRILTNPVRRLNVFVAIARFMWMIAGNDRLKDIAFYEPKVLGFSDDQMTVPGSDYGKRLLMPEPGIDQVRALVDRITKDSGTRRALAAIYRPEDAVRESKDIPCAFGIAFHVRNSKLHMTTVMRSNAAWSLLPFNVFEFTLLGELVAVLANVPLGTYAHIALSLHLYETTSSSPNELELARKAIDLQIDRLVPPMEPMPPTSWEDLARVTQWEADLRYAASGLNVTNYKTFMDRCLAEFSPYWAGLCLALLTYVLMTNGRPRLARSVLERIPEPLRQVLDGHPKLADPDRPVLEEQPVLLGSRASLLEYATRAHVDEAEREELWTVYANDFSELSETTLPGERRRQEVLRVSDWERRHTESRARKKQPALFLQS